VVNGFKVIEWNPLGGRFVVRQSHAHSWVEAYIRPHGWKTFDPGVLRDSSVPQPTFARRWGRHFFDTLETMWVRHVLSYSYESQQEIYSRLHEAMLHVLVRLHFDALDRYLRRIGNADWAVTWRGFLRSPGLRIGLFVAGGVAALFLAFTMLRRLRFERRPDNVVCRIYRRMEHILAGRGFHRRMAQTPWEFHREIALAQWPAVEAVAEITEALCRSRYAGRPPDDAEIAGLHAALDHVQAAARSRKSRDARKSGLGMRPMDTAPARRSSGADAKEEDWRG